MIRHIVLFRLRASDPMERRAQFEMLANTLRPLAETIEGIHSFRVDADPRPENPHWDAALVSEHESWEALAAYQVHPAHVDALSVVSTICAQKAIVDYEL